jgi:ketopantoate reductase
LPLTFNDNDVSEKKLKVGIIGSGAVGSYYGARLLQCGEYDVSFHMRGAHYETCKTSGLQIEVGRKSYFAFQRFLQIQFQRYILTRVNVSNVDTFIAL